MRPPLRGSWWREGIWEARECSNLDGRGRPSSTEVFLEMADRSVRTASGAALRRTADGGCPHVFQGGARGNLHARQNVRFSGQPEGGCPHGSSSKLDACREYECPPHTGNPLQAAHGGLDP